MIDVYPVPVKNRQLRITARRSEEILGLRLERDEIGRLLRSIGLGIEPIDTDTLAVSVPSFRPDLEREIDLIEEVARLHGYDSIPITMPVGRAQSHRPSDHQRRVRQTRDRMVSAGFTEAINYSFISPSSLDRLNLAEEDRRRQTVRILNPLNEEQSVMRTTLVGSLLETIKGNLAYRTRDLRMFELRPVYQPQAGGTCRWKRCVLPP